MSDEVEMVKMTIDGIEVEAPKGTSILEAAKTVGIKIPTFCYHPDLSWSGQCRMCLVEVEKVPKLIPACCSTVMPDGVAYTNSPKVREARRAILEFELLHPPIDSPICDQAGECYLQDYYMEYGLYDSNMRLEDKDHHAKAIPLGEHVVLDRERCVLCFRCVRFCAEVSGTHALKPQWRGGHTEITSFNNEPIEDQYSGNLPDICPVGALTSAKFRFKCRVWFMDKADSICAGCSTGCNIRIDSYQNEIQRYVPRRNPDVNKSWICDEGRMSWTALQNVDRLEKPMIKKDGSLEPVEWREALDVLIAKIKDAGADIAGVASPQMSNEELYLFKTLVMEICESSKLDFRADNSLEANEKMEDNLLRRMDKNPNNRGAAEIGLGVMGMDNLEKDLAAGNVPLLLVYKQDLFVKKPALKESAAGAFTVVFSPYMNATAKEADMVLPVAEYFETEGSFTNYAGLRQRFEKAVSGPGETREGWKLLKEIVIELEDDIKLGNAVSISDLVAEELKEKAEAKQKEEAFEQEKKELEEKAKSAKTEAEEAAKKSQAAAIQAAVEKTRAEAQMEFEMEREQWEEEMDDKIDEAVQKALAEKEAGGE